MEALSLQERRRIAVDVATEMGYMYPESTIQLIDLGSIVPEGSFRREVRVRLLALKREVASGAIPSIADCGSRIAD